MVKHVNKIKVPAGKVYFDQFANGARTGERYLGSTTGAELTASTNDIQVFDPDYPVHQKLVDVATQADYAGQLTLQDMSLENAALYFMATIDTVAQTATPVAAEAINAGNAVVGGRWYQLGQTAANPGGARDVSAVAVKDAVPTTYAVGTDYDVDLVRGRIYVYTAAEGGSASGKALLVDYTPAANSRTRVRVDQFVQAFGSLRFVADNTIGDNDDVYIPYCVMKPTGPYALKQTGNNNLTAQLNLGIMQSPIAGEPLLVVDGVAA